MRPFRERHEDKSDQLSADAMNNVGFWTRTQDFVRHGGFGGYRFGVDGTARDGKSAGVNNTIATLARRASKTLQDFLIANRAALLEQTNAKSDA